MDYKTLYIIISITVVAIAFFFVIRPSARYKAPDSKLKNVENMKAANKVKSVEGTAPKPKGESKMI